MEGGVDPDSGDIEHRANVGVGSLDSYLTRCSS